MPSVEAAARDISPVAQKRKRSSPSPSSSVSSRSDSRSPSPPPARKRRSASPARGKDGSAIGATNGVANTESGAALRGELAKLSTTRAGGAYIPPARLRALMAEAQAADPGSTEFQRMSWDALKKSITGLVNKVAADNIKHVVPELFAGANLIRGRGLFCRAIMKAQSLSLPFTPVFASLVAIVNTKLPMVGELLVVRLVNQFRRSFRRNDKNVCSATATFIAHLVNQRVAHEILALEILVLLLEKPTDDSVEVAVAFMREVGAFLAEESPKANNSIYDRFRAVLYEGSISKRVQYMIEVLSQVRREKYKDNPIVPTGLDLVEEEDQITHKVGLDDNVNVEEGLNMFKADPQFVEHEEQYREIKAEILGEGSDEESGSESDDESSSSDGDASDDDAGAQLEIQDRTETNLVNLRRTIYLTIMSSAIFEEATHKLLKLRVPEEQEVELCNMIVECCSQERTFSQFYGNIGERMSKLNRKWSGLYEECFRTYYDGIHRYETNRLRNIARFFGTLLATDSISWASFEIIHMNEDDTTSSSRIFVKILFQEMLEILGLKTLITRFTEPTMQDAYANMFPRDNPKNTRFSVNFFTSIGLGALTEGMREHLKQIPLLLQQQRQAAMAAKAAGRGSRSDSDLDSSGSLSDSDSSSVLSSSSSGSYSSRSRSRSRSPYSPPPRRRSPPSRRRGRRDAFSPDRDDSPPPRRRRSSSASSFDSRYDSRDSRSRSRTPLSPRRRRTPPRSYGRRGRSLSRTPPSERSRSRSRSSSFDSRRRSPPPPRRASSYSDESRSPSPPPPRRRYDDDNDADRAPRRSGGGHDDRRGGYREDPRRYDSDRRGGGGQSYGRNRDGDARRSPSSPPPPRRRYAEEDDDDDRRRPRRYSPPSRAPRRDDRDDRQRR